MHTNKPQLPYDLTNFRHDTAALISCSAMRSRGDQILLQCVVCSVYDKNCPSLRGGELGVRCMRRDPQFEIKFTGYFSDGLMSSELKM